MANKRINAQMTGMQGVFLAAAELTKRGLVASPTSRSSFGADILATDAECAKSWSVQVKTNAGSASFWLLNKHSKKTKSATHIYVLINLNQKDRRALREPEFYIVPSCELAKHMYETPPRGSSGAVFYAISRKDVAGFKDKWAVFEK